MTRPPEFDDLVGGDLPAEERRRLERVHELLVAAGPPPELRAMLEEPAVPPLASLRPSRRPARGRALGLLLAAALAAAAFAGGYLAGSDEPAFAVERTLPMRGTALAPTAYGSLEVGEYDGEGNYPMRFTIRGLPAEADGERYELFLTRNGRLVASCGEFRVERGETVVYLNAAYRLKGIDGWVVVRDQDDAVVMTTDDADDRRQRGRERGRGRGRGGQDDADRGTDDSERRGSDRGSDSGRRGRSRSGSDDRGRETERSGRGSGSESEQSGSGSRSDTDTDSNSGSGSDDSGASSNSGSGSDSSSGSSGSEESGSRSGSESGSGSGSDSGSDSGSSGSGEEDG